MPEFSYYPIHCGKFVTQHRIWLASYADAHWARCLKDIVSSRSTPRFFYSLIYSCYRLPWTLCALLISINILYSNIILTILDFLHSIEILLRFSSSFFFLFSSCVCICVLVLFLTCILFLLNTGVNWLPGSPSPKGYSKQLVFQQPRSQGLSSTLGTRLVFQLFLLIISELCKSLYKNKWVQIKIDWLKRSLIVVPKVFRTAATILAWLLTESLRVTKNKRLFRFA